MKQGKDWCSVIFVGILALIVMTVATVGMICEFILINKDSTQTQTKIDELLIKGDQLLGKYDQLIVLLTAMATPPIPPPAKKRPRKHRREVAVATAKGGDVDGGI